MRKPSAQSLIEVVSASIVLVPILFVGIDGCVLLTAEHQNSELATNAARLAANKGTRDTAETAAQQVVTQFTKSGMIPNVLLSAMTYDTTNKIVRVETQMDVVPPIPIPTMPSVHLTSTSIQPIVALPATR